ncbi:MAG: tetratricopeptide repeat protein [Acidobacteriaceae bacterium]
MNQSVSTSTGKRRYALSLSLSAFLSFALVGVAATPALAKQSDTVKTDSTTASAGTVDHAASYYHYALAHMYQDMATTYGRPDYATQAVEEYKLALDNDPNSVYLKDGLAELYFKTGHIRDAVLAAQQQIKENPNDLKAHTLLGRIYLRSLGDMQSGTQSGQMLTLAIQEYQKIVELKPDSIENRLLLGQLYALNHDSAHAEEQFKAAQKVDPNSEDAVLNLARLYSDQGDLQRAADVLSAVPEADRTARINFALGVSYDQLKDPKKAIDAYRKALEQEPDNLDAQRGLAQNLFYNGQLNEALQQYLDITAADPQDAQSFLRIGEIERREGKYTEALASVKKAQSLVQNSLEASYTEATIYDSMGRTDDALQIIKKLVTSTTKADGKYNEGEKNNRAIFLDRLANLYREQSKTQEAIDTYKQMIALGGEYVVRGYQGEVDTYRDAHQWASATAAAEEAAKALPDNRGVKLMLAGQLADTGKADEGIQVAKSLLKGTSADRDVNMALAQIYTRLRRYKDASNELDNAEKYAKGQDDKLYIYFLRGTLADRQKNYPAAEAEFHKVLAMDPANAMALNYLGYMWADRGVNLKQALDLLRKAVALDPQNGAYLDSLGWAYFKLGQYSQAEENLRKASEKLSSDPTVHDHLGELYEKTGRLKEATAQWNKSLAEFANSLPADVDPGDVSKVQKKLESAKLKLSKEEHASIAKP